MESKQNKKILFSVLGMSPQILTETIYALSQQTPSFVPDEIYVLTTEAGAKNCKLALFHENGGWFHKLCQTYDLKDIEFTESHILCTTGQNKSPIQDIRSQEDNRNVANQITGMIRKFTADPTSTLHVSIAGGRKTMGFYAGYALSMFGRNQDRLSHVLVQSEYESEPDFFFPTPITDTFKPRFSEVFLDRKEAIVELADLPFVRISQAINKKFLKEAKTFDDCVNLLQKTLKKDLDDVTLQVAHRSLKIGDEVVVLSEANFTFYYWLFKRLKLNQTITASQYDTNDNKTYTLEFLACLEELFGFDYSSRFEDCDASKLDKNKDNRFKGITYDFIRDRKSQIKAKLSEKLGINHSFYEVQKVSNKPVEYSLTIPLEKIKIAW